MPALHKLGADYLGVSDACLRVPGAGVGLSSAQSSGPMNLSEAFKLLPCSCLGFCIFQGFRGSEGLMPCKKYVWGAQQ